MKINRKQQIDRVLGGNSRAHGIAKQLRQGHSPRRVAKFFGVSVEEVLDVARRVG